ncbi:TPA: hypothetical protein I7E95_002466 [Vibrio cholerae]|uniref:hypothetical protein n=1 Tax=Vibrio cholerae TaxID=666 RepID=UPI000E6946AD|nr:hypothetical protein [Vibrio cholerae]HAS5670986.1 hypothetical protein [Vibrio cholerae]HAS5778508.1 hypothetical protein [Vibrio cholerae]
MNLISRRMANSIISEVFSHYPDDFSELIDGTPIKQLVTEKLLSTLDETGQIPDELDIWSVYEDLVIEHKEKVISHNAKLIAEMPIGLEFSNSECSQFAATIACPSGKKFKVVLFDEKGVFSHKSANDPMEISRYLSDYKIQSISEPRFEQFCEREIFVENTAMLMDANKDSVFNLTM